MKKYNAFILFFFASWSVFAGTEPAIITFNDGETFEYALSKYNYSRIAVLGEKIVKVNFPEGRFIIDKDSALKARGDEIYIKPISSLKTNIYFLTNKGHSFSLGVTQADGLGKTIHFISKELSGRIHTEKNEGYLVTIEKVMNDMLLGDLPKGFTAYYPKDRDFRIKKLDLHLITLVKGKGLSGFIYKFTNNTSTVQHVEPSMFSNKRVRAIALSEENIKPRQSGYLFSLLGATA